jgi:uncharacterized membrane protein
MNRSRFIVGLILVIIAVLLYFFSEFNTAGIIAIGVLGLVSIAISRKNNKRNSS